MKLSKEFSALEIQISDIEEMAKPGVAKENLHPPANQEVVGSRPIIRPTLILCN